MMVTKNVYWKYIYLDCVEYNCCLHGLLWLDLFQWFQQCIKFNAGDLVNYRIYLYTLHSAGHLQKMCCYVHLAIFAVICLDTVEESIGTFHVAVTNPVMLDHSPLGNRCSENWMLSVVVENSIKAFSYTSLATKDERPRNN